MTEIGFRSQAELDDDEGTEGEPVTAKKSESVTTSEAQGSEEKVWTVDELEAMSQSIG